MVSYSPLPVDVVVVKASNTLGRASRYLVRRAWQPVPVTSWRTAELYFVPRASERGLEFRSDLGLHLGLIRLHLHRVQTFGVHAGPDMCTAEAAGAAVGARMRRVSPPASRRPRRRESVVAASTKALQRVRESASVSHTHDRA